jgi:hypothetical protein
MAVRKRADYGGSGKTGVPTAGANMQSVDKSPVTGNGITEGGERVDQIREILFGAQRQEYERRLTQLEELLVKNIAELSKETAGKFTGHQQENDKKFARLEELLLKNIADISREIERKIDLHKGENDKRFQQLEQHFDEALSELKKETVRQFNLQKSEYIQKLNSLEEKLAKAISEVNKRVDADVASLTKDINAARSESVRSLEQLDRQKMDRYSLAKYLHNAAAGVEGKEHKTDTGVK